MSKKTGPKPAPTVVKLLRGDPKASAKDGAEPLGDYLKTLPKPGAEVKAVAGAVDVFNEYGKKLIKAKILTDLDLVALSQFAVWTAKWAEAEKQLARREAVVISPDGGEYQSPWVSIAKQTAQMVDKWGALLGLNPSERTRLKVSRPDGGGDLPGL